MPVFSWSPNGHPGCPGTSSEAYTLIEMLIVMALLLTLAAVTVDMCGDYVREVQLMRATIELGTIEKAIEDFKTDHGDYPVSLDVLDLKKRTDPWREPYVYLKIHGVRGGRGSARKDRFLVPLNTDYDLYSKGPDRRSQPPLTAALSYDDIIRAGNGVFVGPVSKY